MKTYSQLETEARRVHGEIQLSFTKDPIAFTTAAVRRLRQLEHDAVLDFIESLPLFHDGVKGWLKEELLEYASLTNITRAPSSGCKDGKCGL